MGASSEVTTGGPDTAEQDTLGEIDDSRRTAPVELLWDLVFVFAVTQVTTLLHRDLSWAGFGRSMLVLALVWWAWSAFVWAANAQTDSSPTLVGILLAATACIFVAGIALPRAFGGEATLFACAYAAVRVLHLVLYADASRRGNASWSSIAGFAVTVAIGMALLIAGSFLAQGLRLAFWSVAVAIDYAGPGLLTRARLRNLQRVAVAHFAERYGLFVIIALGESIVAIGVSARTGHLDARLIGTVTLCLLITVGLWWMYFAHFAERTQARLHEHSEPVLAAADAYSYLHLVIIAGIIIFAVGARLVVSATGGALADAGRLALCGGVALYLGGLVTSGMRLLGSDAGLRLAGAKLGAALALVATGLFAAELEAWVAAAIVCAVLALLSVGEAVPWQRHWVGSGA